MNATITAHFEFVFAGKPVQLNHMIKLNALRPHVNKKLAFSNSSGLKSVFEKLRFLDRLVWTLGLTGEIKMRFQISPA